MKLVGLTRRKNGRILIYRVLNMREYDALLLSGRLSLNRSSPTLYKDVIPTSRVLHLTNEYVTIRHICTSRDNADGMLEIMLY